MKHDRPRAPRAPRRRRQGFAAAAVAVTMVAGMAGLSAFAGPASADPSTPALSVTPTTAGLDRDAPTTVTVSGSGYDPAKGIYLIYGVRPANDAVSTATRSASVTKLVQAVPTTDTQVKLESDGTFTTTIALNRVFTVTSGGTTTSFDCAVVACTVYTMRNHTDFTDRTQDASVAVAFAPATDPGPGPGPGPGAGGGGGGAGTPSVTVSPASGLDPAATTTLNVSGSGFDAAANGGVGIYLAFGAKASDYATNAGAFLVSKWIHVGATASSGQAPMTSSGTFSTTLPGVTAKYTDSSGKAVDCLMTQCYVVTVGAHGLVTSSQETFTPVSFVGGSIVDDGTPAGTVKVASASVNLGGSQTVTASGFDDGETVKATLHSDPYDLGTVVATGGSVSLTFTLPSGIAPGVHHVELVGMTSGLTATIAFTVIDPDAAGEGSGTDPSGVGSTAGGGTLPFTGAPIAALGALAVAMVVAGAALTRAAKGRRTARAPV